MLINFAENVRNFYTVKSHFFWTKCGRFCFHTVCLGGGRVVRWYWVNFQCRGVLLIWIRVGKGPTALSVGVGCLDIFSLTYHFSFLSPSLWETARYRLKNCLKGLLSPKQTTVCLKKYNILLKKTDAHLKF